MEGLRGPMVYDSPRIYERALLGRKTTEFGPR